MLLKLLIFALVPLCSASLFNRWKDEASKLLPQKNVERFLIGLPKQVRGEINPETAENLMNKVQSALLIHGVPLGSLQKGGPFSLGSRNDQLSLTDHSGRRLKLGSYNIANCTSPPPEKAKFVIHSLTISPDPVEIPGSLTITFDIDVLVDIASAEVKVDMELKKGSTTVKIPCVGSQIGSCDYKDICSLLSQVTSCPPEFDAAKIPCKCPFSKGFYKLPGISVEIDAEVFVSGDYTVTANATSGGDFLGCYIINFTITD